MPGDHARIGEPQDKNGGPRDVLRYSNDGDPLTVEHANAGISLKIGLWRNDLVGVYLYPADGEIVAALYGPGSPGLGTMWLDKWLGIWIVKNNGGAPVTSNVKPIWIRAPLPD